MPVQLPITFSTVLLVLTSFIGNCRSQNSSTVDEDQHIPLNSVIWDEGGFWGARLDACQSGLAKSMTPLMLGSEKSQFVANFRIAAGMEAGKHRGPAWNDGDCYKWIEAVSALYAMSRDPSLRELLDNVVAIISAAQRSDGYLHTPVIIASRDQSHDTNSFGDPKNFEMYNMGHLMTAACVHFEATGDRGLLAVAVKAADYLDREFAQPDASLARHAICPAHYLGAIDLFRTTGDERYLQLCQRWISMRDLVQGGGDDNQDRIPFLQQREAVGHAVRANYLFAGAADLYLETADDRLMETLSACWNSVHQRKIYVTGGCGALYDGASPDGSDQQSTITRIHQAYGRNYQLPNSTAHNETCAAIGNVLWNRRMWQITHDAKYVDALETSLYNAVLVGVSLDGQRYFYTNTLRQLDDMPVPLRWPRQRQSWISCYCCPPNVARTIAQVGRLAYSVNNQAAIVLLYGSNSLDVKLSNSEQLTLQQQSDYPMQGQIRLQVKNCPSYSYSLGLRIPGWCQSAKISINGKTQLIESKPGSITYIKRQWQVDDIVELELSMPVQYLEAHPLVEECRGQIAIRRGPLVYCLESTDLPKQSSVQHVHIVANSENDWTVEIGQGAIAGVPLLTGKLLVQLPRDKSNANESALYRKFEATSNETVSAKLIPYYAWGNRGPSEMTVWIQVQK